MQRLNELVAGQLDALCADACGPIGVAVSGGSDSLALLYLAAEWAAERAIAPRTLIVFTVDHGLRAEAGGEASMVGCHAAKLGLEHRTLRWRPGASHASQTHVSQDKARRARHGLLAGALRDAGGTYMLMGHTLDDQIETTAMRATRPGGGRGAGLGGMRALSISPIWPEGRGVFIVRPCLGVRRQALQEGLRGRAVDWVQDPSNDNPAYERVRVRRHLAKAGAGELAETLAASQTARASVDAALAAWLTHEVTANADGLIICTPGALEADALAEGLAYLIMAAAGEDRRAGRPGRRVLAADILRTPGKWRARTLGGAWIAPRKGAIHIARDPGFAGADGGLATDADGVWDGRFVISNPANPPILARNLQPDLHTDMIISPMARAGYPDNVTGQDHVECLVPGRLKDVRKMLEYVHLAHETG